MTLPVALLTDLSTVVGADTLTTLHNMGSKSFRRPAYPTEFVDCVQNGHATQQMLHKKLSVYSLGMCSVLSVKVLWDGCEQLHWAISVTRVSTQLKRP